eukprot:scaffold36509_cov33-Tisochrysis_lutea.AAC.3
MIFLFKSLLFLRKNPTAHTRPSSKQTVQCEPDSSSLITSSPTPHRHTTYSRSPSHTRPSSARRDIRLIQFHTATLFVPA